MAYVYFNNNPRHDRVGDCAVRAIAKALDMTWKEAYIALCAEGLIFKDLPSSNYVWGMCLKRNGFEEHPISSVCPNCTSVSQFAKDHPKGIYVLACQNHVVAVVDGDYFDSWDSGNEIVIYYYRKEI